MHLVREESEYLLRTFIIDGHWFDGMEGTAECRLECLDIMRPVFEHIGCSVTERHDAIANWYVGMCIHDLLQQLGDDIWIFTVIIASTHTLDMIQMCQIRVIWIGAGLL